MDNRDLKSDQKGNGRLPTWMIVLLFVLAVSIVGAGLSAFIGTSIPFWILFGFSAIYSIEKWLSYDTRKHKWLGRLYRLILNLGILSLLGLVIWSGIKLFSHQFVQNALIGSIVFVAEFIFFIWVWRVISKNSWRWPSMKLTIFTVIYLFLVFSFAGVQPMSSYKDTALSKIQSAFSSNNNNPTTITYSNNIATTPIKTVASTTTTFLTTTGQPNTIALTSHTTSTVPTITAGINSKTGVYKNYYLGVVDSSEGVIGGDGCYDDTGDFIILINNKNATDPTYSQLINFLQDCKIDEYPYIYTGLTAGYYYGTAESHVDLKNIQNIIDGTATPSNPDVCSDFAERLHNEAEKAGIRCAYVSLGMTGYSDPAHLGIPSNAGHACNAFQTTDRGLVYIDATGMSPNIPHPTRPISTVNITIGQQYIPISLFPEIGWQSAGESMGTVTNMQVFWDGTWNN